MNNGGAEYAHLLLKEGSEKSGYVHSACNLRHFPAQFSLDLFEGVIDGGNDLVLVHLHVLRVHCLFFYRE